MVHVDYIFFTGKGNKDVTEFEQVTFNEMITIYNVQFVLE
jgi:hypothetical protein